MMLVQETTFKLKQWTVSEYHQLISKGVFHPEERVELIEGQIIQMSAKGTAHTSALGRIDRLLQRGLGELAWIRIQDPIQLSYNSQPEPDVSVVKFDPLDYSNHHPTADEVYLIIEVADTSLAYDVEIKTQVYAQAGIADYWVLDVNNRHLLVFRDPSSEGYRSRVTLDEKQQISPLAFSDLAIAIVDILPPK